ncbi:MAG: acyloxyacyl hydrolase [Melioribacteraceae bacterium]|nr:acyloxyacyl hydrolase [Melioribacteraceae bacterium]MDD3558219.1 acyloxyacyl hydrolase [Melioribacteraceae bacterium]
MLRFADYFFFKHTSLGLYCKRQDNYKFAKIFFISGLFFLLYNNSHAQTIDMHQFYLAKGNSLSKSASSEQIMIMQKILTLYTFNETFTVETNIVYELISESKETNYLVGTMPLLKWGFDLIQRRFVLFGGIGVNYISSDNIVGRNLGGNFIFSDLIGIGINLYRFYDYEIDLSYVFKHISNAGFYKDNEGFNSHYLMISLKL